MSVTSLRNHLLPNASSCLLGLLVLLLPLLVGQAAQAQTDDIELRVGLSDVGLSGYVRAGAWNPLRVRLTNLSAEPRQVRCQWIVPDIDGDPVYYERMATISPQRQQSVWLYAALPITTNPQTVWDVQVIDEKSGDMLARTAVSPERDFLISLRHRAIGLTGSSTIGLAPYTTDATQHEPARLLLDLYPGDFPDRWHGYSALRSLVWTPQGGDPNDANIPPQALAALSDWVRRGGHLVVVLPAIGDPWSASPLGALLPDLRMTTVTGVDAPTFLGSPVAQEVTPIDVKLLQPASGSNAAVLLTDDLDQPLCVAHSVGMGRVTVLGVNLEDSQLRRMNLPNGRTLWQTIFGWQGEAFTDKYIESLRNNNQISLTTFRDSDRIDGFVSSRISMQATTSTALLLALLLFGIYWLVAGPGLFAVLKNRGQVRHSWLAFVVAIAAFSAIAWGGAVLIRPSTTGIEHFSVIDAKAEAANVRVSSWATLFVPDHGQVAIELAPNQKEDNHNTISNVGLETDERGVFLGRQRYTVDAAAPHRITPPMRSTAKGLQMQYLGDLFQDNQHLASEWVMPAGSFTRGSDGFPIGKVSHGLPVAVQNLLVVFDRGDGQPPMVWRRYKPWEPGEVLEISRAAMIPSRPVDPDNPNNPNNPNNPSPNNANPAGQAANNQPQPTAATVQRLWIPPMGSGPNRRWGGHLADLIRQRPNTIAQFGQGNQPTVNDAQLVRLMELLTFYEALPTPAWWRTGINDRAVMLHRTYMRDIDRSEQLALNRIHFIGYLPDTTLPMPLTVDRGIAPSKGWTVLRWSAPFQ